MVLKKILLTGGSGRLGKFLINNLNKEVYDIIAPSSKELDITNVELVKEQLGLYNPDIILHSAAYTDVKKAEKEYLKAIDINVVGTINLLTYASKNNLDFIYISTDSVFDGKKGGYRPSDKINPINKYSKTKTAAELCCRMYNKTTIIRTAFFEYQFPYDVAFYDQFTSKDYLDIIGPKIVNVIHDYKFGIYHIGSKRRSVYDIAISRNQDVKRETKNNFNFTVLEDTSFDEHEIYGEL